MIKPLIPVAIATTALLLAACGKKEPVAAAAAAPTAAPTSAPAPAFDGVQLEISGNDQMKFNVTRLEAPAGASVKLKLTNVGTMPKQAMGHNWVLLKKGTNVENYCGAAVAAQATDYLPASKANEVIAATRMLGPKESQEITFQAPTEAGEYVFVCTFPAHFAMGMKGVLVVK